MGYSGFQYPKDFLAARRTGLFKKIEHYEIYIICLRWGTSLLVEMNAYFVHDERPALLRGRHVLRITDFSLFNECHILPFPFGNWPADLFFNKCFTLVLQIK
jgi:hypothetical protein